MSRGSFRDYQESMQIPESNYGLRPPRQLFPEHNVAAMPDEEDLDDMPQPTAAELMAQPGSVDLDNLPKQRHNWVDRGTVMSCEGAGHANHHAFKTRNR